VPNDAAERAVERALEKTRTRAEGGAALSWRIVERPGATTVEFTGDIDENADFGELKRRLKGAVAFELAGIRRINSFGVREWIDFIRQLPAVTELSLAGCSPAFVVQMNMIANFRGPGKVRSIQAPFVCGDCGEEHDQLIELPAERARPRTGPGPDLCPPRACPSCSGTMTLDEQPERYLAFLLDP
jgi:hypothetical protein